MLKLNKEVGHPHTKRGDGCMEKVDQTYPTEKLGDYVQTADWKKEKHIPVIDCPTKAKAGELIEVKISVGKEIAHPNTTEHFIAWINLFFKPTGEKNVYNLGFFTFNAHGSSTDGPNTSTVYTQHAVNAFFKTSKSGTLYAVSHCNIHGLWQSSKELTIQ